MSYIFKPLIRFETKELIKEIRETSIHIACIQYDLNYSLYLNHPSNLIEDFTQEITCYKEYKLELESELQKRS